MTKRNPAIVVIGTGPSSASFCQRMHDLNYQVTVLTDGKIKDVSYADRIAKIDGLSEIWKLNNTQSDVRTSVEKENNFHHIKIDGVGGLSNRWGGGIARLDKNDLGVSTEIANGIGTYYEYIENMIGTSCNQGDALSKYLGEFGKNIPGYSSIEKMSISSTENVIVGNSAQAITFKGAHKTDRTSCNFCGHCSVFCGRKSFYSSNDTFVSLRNFHKIEEELSVKSIIKDNNKFEIFGVQKGVERLLKADFVVLAAGSLNSLKLLENILPSDSGISIKILNTPSLRGIAFAPFRKMRKNLTAITTVAKIKINDHDNAFLSFVEGQSIPVSDWLSFIPVKNKLSAWFLQKIRKYFVAYMIFFNSDHSDNRIEFKNGVLRVSGGHAKSFSLASKIASKHLKQFFRKNMFVDLFLLQKILQPGRDIHYGGTLPMSSNSDNCTNADCELEGCPGLYMIDASWMPRISEKSHTFTLMANAARVADIIHERKVN